MREKDKSMSTIVAAGPNSDQIEYWNGMAGARWVTHQEKLDASIGGIGADAMSRAQVKEGERVVDVGCGCGHTTLDIAHQVGTSGKVLGVDISTPMLDLARSRMDDAEINHVHFANADAETHKFDDDQFDLLFSRFGVMFFGDPVAAFRNLGSVLGSGGRLVFVCWRSPEDNPWLVQPAKVAGEHIELPPRAGPGEPGPFAFADPDRVKRILASAGFDNIELEQRDGDLQLGGPQSLDDAVDFALKLGPSAMPLAEADAETAETVIQSVRTFLEPHYTGSAVEMPSSAWIVTASRI
jgi:SAM-dependent methyltransferase